MKHFSVKVTISLMVTILLFGLSAAAYGATKVYLLPIQGDIEPGLATFVARGVNLAERNNGIILIEINTFGGRVDSATEIRDLLIKADVPVIAFVSERAWSAGALITLSAPKVVMAPGSSIGAAEPRPFDEKAVSALKAEFEATAERTGRNKQVAAAMVDADVVIEDLIAKDKILTLSTQDAVEWGMADFIANNRHEVLNRLGYDEYDLIELQPHWAERIARFLTNPTVSSLLLTLGFLGLVVEVTTPGWGVPGTAGVISLILFFGGRFVSGFAGFEEIGLFLLGLILLFIEGFIIPGFGIVGILGIVSVVTSIILVFGDIQVALISLSIALTVSIIAFAFLWKNIKNTKFWKRVVLSHSESKELGYRAPSSYEHLLGKRGTTISTLRPAGTIVIEDNRVDVVSEGGFISVNSLVEVVATEGTKVIVREIED
ncbi:MAG TPA: nodulation protein NfeD [Natronincola sp.]|nr:nodulation protein NfeD [Natronincola sp.]